ncbi:CPBP family intramembrane glutamic endopeptidase [Enterococcus durans]|uniref:CPBP family intramembrane glutamic endopeptidase n=1 Tax=Enterococcus durans TaxID=53345 RepID=UPI0039C6CDD7
MCFLKRKYEPNKRCFYDDKLCNHFVLSALIFGSIHASSNILTFIGFSLVGLNLGALYLISGNLIVPITVHFLNNLSASLNVSNDVKRISIFICLLLIICLIEYVS